MSITQDSTDIAWTIRPVLFLPLAHRRYTELAAYTDDFKRHATDAQPSHSRGPRVPHARVESQLMVDGSASGDA